ncbi:mitochondrial ribosomal protein S26 [Phyllostomus discolor]|uniref:Small ribosomal subunit protein mS26 n=1 Tax=Phyllostomus discolor TaxID=89673 RepID=A0A834DM73_9CHIR|nr:mitochondrial ribosomal protein S26 [Phyllostomus discolor]
MLRALNHLGVRPPAPLLLPARGRKTRHDPPAKSKVGRVRTPPAVDPTEFYVLTERYRQYRQTVRALRLEFVSEVRRKIKEARTGVLAERKALEDATEHQNLMAWNQAENQRLHELRIERLRQEAREQEQRQEEEKARKAPSPGRGRWSGRNARAPKGPLRTVPAQGLCAEAYEG